MQISARLTRPSFYFYWFVLGALCLSVVSRASGQSIRVDKIEPPNWWVGMKHNRVQLMVNGSDLSDCQVESNHRGLKVVGVEPVGNPNYTFVNIEVSPSLPPGDYELRFKVPGQDSASFSFPVLSRSDSSNRHQGFSHRDVIYLITPDRFANGDPANDRAPGTLDEFDPGQHAKRHGGDLQGIIDHLDYLQDLGVTALWLNPVLENRGINSYHGYKTTDWYKIDPRFGTNEDYRTLVEAAHRKGMKIIFDHVANHIGIRHPWIKNLPEPDWLNGSVEDHLLEKHYLLSLSDPHADPNSKRELKDFWFVDRMPDLNQRNPRLAKYLIQNSIWWIEYSGLDGIREDTYPYVDQNFMAKWAKAIRLEYPDFNIVGEIWATHSAYIAQFQERTILPRDFETHLPAVMDFPLMEAVRRFLDGSGKLRDLHAVYAQDFLFTDVNNLLVFGDNHDTPRMMFVANENVARVKLALTLLLTTRGTPQLLYGTELGMVGGESHVELRANFPGGFPGDKRAAFEAEGRTRLENEMHEFVKQLLHLRKKHPALSQGKMIHYAPTWRNDIYRVLKVFEDGLRSEKILILTNGHEERKTVRLDDLAHHLESCRLIDLKTGKECDWRAGIQLKPLEARLLRLSDSP